MAPIFHHVVDRLNQNPQKNHAQNDQRMILTMQPASISGHYSKITCAEDSCHNAETGVKKLENHVTNIILICILYTSFVENYMPYAPTEIKAPIIPLVLQIAAHLCMFGTIVYGASPCQEQKQVTIFGFKTNEIFEEMMLDMTKWKMVLEHLVVGKL